MTNELIALQSWCANHCDGDWERQHGIGIDTLDNPDWRAVAADGRVSMTFARSGSMMLSATRVISWRTQ